MKLNSKQLYDLFYERIKKLRTISSISKKAKYKIIETNHDKIKFIRTNTSEMWEIKKEEIFSVLNFIKDNKFNTTTLRINKLVPRKQSPTIAFLIATQMVEQTQKSILSMIIDFLFSLIKK